MIEVIKKDLIKNISKSRYEHTLRVVEVCKRLAQIHGVDLEKARVAAYLHDSAKFPSKEKIFNLAKKLGLLDKQIYFYNKELIHAPLGAKLAMNNYNIMDEDIINSIRYHTTGRKNMSSLEKIIFMGDYTEPYRKFKGIEIIRELAYKDLDKSLLLALNTNLKFLLNNKRLIATDTIEARNCLMV